MIDHGVMGLTPKENASLNEVGRYIPPNDAWDSYEELRWLLAELVELRANRVPLPRKEHDNE